MAIFNLKDRAVRFSEQTGAPTKDTGLITFSSTNRLTLTSRESFSNFFPVIPSIISDIFGIQLVIANTLELKEVKNLKFSYSAEIAQEYGIQVAFLQPWYIKPVTITMQGTSYIGFVPYISVTDDDVAQIYKRMKNTLGEIVNGKGGNKNKILLEIVNNPKDTDRFLGWFSNFDFTENIEKPFLLDYDITFIGKPDISTASNAANSSANIDNTKAKPIIKVPGTVGIGGQ